jgi:hypothetical protein
MYTEEDIRMIMKLIHEKLPNGLKIPSKAWRLLSNKAKDKFFSERDKILEWACTITT